MAFEERVATLSFAVRPWVIGCYVGQLSLVLFIMSLAPLLTSLLYGETTLTPYYGVVSLALLMMGALSRIPNNHQLQTNEAMVITTIMFIVMPLLACIPMMQASGMAFIDALFEGVSAVTTTGLSTLATVEDKPHTFLFARAWMQWYGGLGIVVLTIALLLGSSAISRKLAQLQMEREDIVGSAKLIARKALTIYLILTLLGIALLWLNGVAPQHAVTHTLSAVSTGGFSSYDAGLAAFSGSQQALITLFSLLGAIPLLLYYRCYAEGWQALHSNIQVRAMLGLMALLSVALMASLQLASGIPWQEALAMGTMLAVSAQSTTGFSPMAISELDNGSKLLLIFSMLTGGGLGSTAGGIKILRLLILLRLLQLLLQRASLPERAIAEPRLAGERLEGPDIERALLLILIYLLIIFFSWLPFVIMGYDPLDSLFEVVSASATVGLSSGITRSELEPLLKGILCFDMLAGRVEIIALLVVLYPPTWLGKRKG